ncbi:hypothetical protein HDU87_007455 [Geranomyces variabilis]|uniref:Uncharacterized protein n=1 Tax=Geranomyces variabilis TaxID=109894 RepID=A0AAD5XPU3_9FUNG|nr:hypothetical protein HDU87_007455 [Geranomyces variabilis]
MASSVGERERNIYAAFHLFVAYTIVWGCKWGRSAAGKGSLSRDGASTMILPPLPSVAINDTKSPTWSRVAMVTVLASLFAVAVDEIAYLILAHGVLGPVVMGVRGAAPAPPGTIDDDCVICLGVGLGDDDQPPTAQEISAALTEGLDAATISGAAAPLGSSSALESFCKIPTHVAHVDCMLRLYAMRRYGRKCPVCRRRLRVRVVDDRTVVADMGWVKGLPWIITRSWQWGPFFDRSSVTSGCILGVLLTVVASRTARLGRLKQLI